MVAVTGPNGPFDPFEYTLNTDTMLYRLFGARAMRLPTDFNPGKGEPTRFAFFADADSQVVPVLYAATTQEVAICESILHEIPPGGGVLLPADYQDKGMAGLRPARDLRLASFMGMGLRRLGLEHTEITSTTPARYAETVLRAKAAHEAGFDGAAWMSHRCNTDIAVVLFGDRVLPGDLVQDLSFGRFFDLGPDRDWLSSMCQTIRVEVRW